MWNVDKLACVDLIARVNLDWTQGEVQKECIWEICEYLQESRFWRFNPNAYSRMKCSCCRVLPKATQHEPSHTLSRDTMVGPLNILDLTITTCITETYCGNPGYQIYKVRECIKLFNFPKKTSKRKAELGVDVLASKACISRTKQKVTVVSRQLSIISSQRNDPPSPGLRRSSCPVLVARSTH